MGSIIADIVFWCKWITACIHIKFHRKFNKSRFDLYDMDALNDPVKISMLPPEDEKILESPHNQSSVNEAADEVIFYGVNSSSECFMARISRRCNEEAEVGLYLKLRNGNIYQLENVCCPQKVSKYNNIFTGGGLKMYYTEPMRKWRLFYKGLLRQTSVSDEAPTRMVYVKFGLQWRASTDCFDTLTDIGCSELAKALARPKWNRFLPDLKTFHNAVNSYSQSGVIRGEVCIENVDENMELYLFGEKIRYLGNAKNLEGYRFSRILGHITKNGRIVHITELHIPQIVESLVYGYVVTPEGKVEPATNIKVMKDHLWNDNESIDMQFHTNELDYNLKVTEENPAYKFGVENEYHMSMKNLEIELNSSLGRGILIEGNILKPKMKIVTQSVTKDIQKDIPLTVSFMDPICQIPDITGGKGSSLGKLTQLSELYQNFIVPKGIVVTTSAYQNFMTEAVLKQVKNLTDILYENPPRDFKQACQRTMDDIIETDLPKVVCQSITENLQREFGDAFHQKMFAVRSSATGEDSEELSAAGQMETFLGVSGLEHIMLCVKKCWASQFSHVAVQYKRQNGQVLNSPMAIVIQEMVLCEVAGVLFTCDPVSGNPTLVSITANYGLGETVVSGSEEPDTIVLERDVDGNLKIKEKIIGAKSHRTVIKGKGPSPEEVPEAERLACCLSDSLSFRLGNIAINIEKSYGSERDIEWGYLTDNFYIFQSRPVTSNNEETDYEIDHENDAPMRVENEYFCVCNVGEVMPGSTSPLGADVMIKFFNATFQRQMFTKLRPFSPKYFQKGLVTMYNHTMAIAADLFEYINDGETFLKCIMISYFGRIIEDDELFALVKERFQLKKKMSRTAFFSIFMKVFTASKMLKKLRKQYENHRLCLDDCKTSSDLYEALIRSCTYPVDAFICHMICTNKSSMSNMFLLQTFEKAKDEIDTDVYNDLSELLSSISEVESADVPSAMESLAYHIAKDITAADFQQMSVEDAENWLVSSTSESGQRFRDFLKKHGHRCLKEFDIRTPTWGENPKQLVKLLQNLTGSVSKDRTKKETKTFQEIMSKLKIPLGTKDRLMLRFFLLPFSRSGIQLREGSKSLLIKAFHEWRKGYKKLAKLMVSEGRIPDEDLLFFMTLLEIQELLKTRSPKIIARATHRRRRYPLLDNYIFPEIASGVPKPVNLGHLEVLNSDENFSMKGIPVSQGVAKGFLRVALTLDEASFLKPGEILLTYSTDIGWTPYFPILAGLGTELGGLISHGAVVSREYGLPCIAGLHGATRQFQTGDYVLLDASKGILQKLSLPE